MGELVCRRPHPRLRGYVLAYRGFRFAEVMAHRRRIVVPDGNVKIMVGFGQPVRVVDARTPERSVTAPSLVTGIRATAAIGEHTGGAHGILILLTPMAAYRIFGIPAPEWSDLHDDPLGLLGPPARSLAERLVACVSWDERFAELDYLLESRMALGPSFVPEVVGAWRALRRSSGTLRISDLANASGWSRRHFERRFRAHMGVTAKEAAQIVRLQAALQLRRMGSSWARVAAELGYHDQPHFDHTFRAMVGCTPGSFQESRSGVAFDAAQDFLPGHVSSALLSGC
ncbi:helix-turn-helix domain-containing protein [Streptomyces sp. NPDC048436]|uniref:helix-turn-helix transcriptional regulator n=1 Tax=Streptomyces sp. NPDC048436 TaxID=3365550 RepID=UPI003712B6C5